MIDQIMSTSSLQPYLEALINTEKVRVREENRVFMIEPVNEKEYNCPLFGAAIGSKLTVEKFLAMTRADKELDKASIIKFMWLR